MPQPTLEMRSRHQIALQRHIHEKNALVAEQKPNACRMKPHTIKSIEAGSIPGTRNVTYTNGHVQCQYFDKNLNRWDVSEDIIGRPQFPHDLKTRPTCAQYRQAVHASAGRQHFQRYTRSHSLNQLITWVGMQIL